MSEQQDNLPATQPQGMELVEHNVHQRQLLQTMISDVFGSLGGPSLDNFDGQPNEKWKLKALATGPHCKTFDDIGDRELEIRYFYVHPIRLDGATLGEYVDTLRTVLIDANGDAFAFVSTVLARDLANMVQTFGLQPWNPPIRVKITVSPGKSGHKFYNIVPAN